MSFDPQVELRPLERYHFDRILELGEDDFFRDGLVIHIANIFHRIIMLIVDFFTGGRELLDNRQFNRVYTSSLVQRVSLLERMSNAGQYSEEFFTDLKKVLIVLAKLQVSGWASSLTARGNHNFQDFTARLSALHAEGRRQVNEWASHNREPAAVELRRWIESSPFQRNFAAASESGQLPYRMSEVPAGAVLLSEVDSSLLGLRVKGITPTFCQLFRKFKAAIMELFTGSAVTHAELCLGNGRVFHLDKRDDQWFSGNGFVEERAHGERGEERICYHHEIWVPDRERIVAEYNERHPGAPVRNFDELFAQMNRQIERSGHRMTISLASIIKLGFPSARPENYDAARAWAPGAREFACSGAVAALYGRIGVDLGHELDKMAEEVTPGDYRRHSYFQRFFTHSNRP
jgi:hypothetical protein